MQKNQRRRAEKPAGPSSGPSTVPRPAWTGLLDVVPSVPWLGYGKAVLMVAGAVALSWLLSRLLVEPTNLAMVFLLAVTYTAVRQGAGPAALAALLGVAALDFFFVEPHLTFAVRDTQYLLTFAVMAGVGLLISHLTALLRGQAQEARERERRTAELYALSRKMTRAASTDEVVRHAARHIADLVGARVAVYLADSAGRLELRAVAAQPALAAKGGPDPAPRLGGGEAGVGIFPGPEASPGMLHVPLLVGRRPVGVLTVAGGQGDARVASDQHDHLEAIANLVALAIERARLAQAAQEAAVEAEAERLRSSLLASVSHDLRTPLATIAGSAAALLESGSDEATRRELAESVHDEALRLNRYVEKLLAMTRLEAGKVRVNREWQPIEDAIGAALARVERELGQRQVRLDVPPELPLAPFDASLIEQVLVNLLENACRYAGPDAIIEIRAWAEEQGLVVEVADSGAGLEPGSERRVFEKFYRARQQGEGAGLGLAICTAIVMAHGGTMWAANRPGGGAAFSFVIPFEGEPPELARVRELGEAAP
ncbi:MAG: DUF4118 domain-containing protein [Acidobacteriota bacterium]